MNTNVKFNENMTGMEAQTIYFTEFKKCKTKTEKEQLWSEYEPVLDAILEKEAKWREENPNVLTSWQ